MRIDEQHLAVRTGVDDVSQAAQVSAQGRAVISVRRVSAMFSCVVQYRAELVVVLARVVPPSQVWKTQPLQLGCGQLIHQFIYTAMKFALETLAQ